MGDPRLVDQDSMHAARTPAPIGYALLIGLGLTLLGALLMTPTLGDLGGDSAQYLALADSLASGEGYRDLHLPDRPLHGHYPPGLPLLLAPVVAAFGKEAYLLSKLVVLVTSVLGLIVAWACLARRGPGWMALAASAMAASTLAFLLQSIRIQSEAPFALLTWGTLLALEPNPYGLRRPHRLLVACALASAAFCMRVAGIVPLLAVAVCALHRERRRGIPVALSCLVVPLAFYAWTLAAGGTWSYAAEIAAATEGGRDLLSHVVAGFRFYAKALGALVCNVPLVGESALFSGILAVPVCIGFAHRCRRPGAPELVLLGMFLLAAAAPMRAVRYLVPLLPLLAWYFLDGLRTVWGLLASLPLGRTGGREGGLDKALHVAAAAVAVANLVPVATVLSRRYEPRTIDPPLELRSELEPVALHHWEEAWFLGDDPKANGLAQAYGDFLLLLAALRARLPEDAILCGRKPRLTAALTGRRCVGLPDEMDAKALEARLRGAGVTHIVADGLFKRTRRVLDATQQKLPLEKLITVRGATCLKLRAPASAGAPR